MKKTGYHPKLKDAAFLSHRHRKGAGRNSNKEFIHFLSIAGGSSYELKTQLILAYELNLIHKQKVEPILELINEIQKMNYSFQKTLA